MNWSEQALIDITTHSDQGKRWLNVETGEVYNEKGVVIRVDTSSFEGSINRVKWALEHPREYKAQCARRSAPPGFWATLWQTIKANW